VWLVITIISLGLFLCFVIYMSWKKAKIAGLFREMKLSGETFIINPEFASFRGATARYGRVKCDGVIGLTNDKIIFIPFIGSKTEIPLKEICDVTEEKKFLGCYRAGMTVLVLHEQEVDIGFYVKDHIKWQNTITGVIKTNKE